MPESDISLKSNLVQPCLPQVSIIIPTYRHRDFVLQTLSSVFDQTFHDYEIIVVNDGSPDDTDSLLKPLIESDRIRYISQINQGQSRARNRGLVEARGKYIAFLDDDDVWPKDKLEWQVEYLESHPKVGLVGGRLEAIDKDGKPLWQGAHYENITFESLFTLNPFLSPGQTLIRADLLRDLGGLNAEIWGADDLDLWFRIAGRSKLVMLDRLALHYRFHANNSSKNVARLLENCCRTVEIHLAKVRAEIRPNIRQVAYESMYKGLGADLVFEAKGHLHARRFSAAVRSVIGLRPLLPHLLLVSAVRKHFLENLCIAGVKRRTRTAIRLFGQNPAENQHDK